MASLTEAGVHCSDHIIYIQAHANFLVNYMPGSACQIKFCTSVGQNCLSLCSSCL